MFFYGSYLPITYFIIESCQSASYRGKQLLKREKEAMESENMLSKHLSSYGAFHLSFTEVKKSVF